MLLGVMCRLRIRRRGLGEGLVGGVGILQCEGLSTGEWSIILRSMLGAKGGWMVDL